MGGTTVEHPCQQGHKRNGQQYQWRQGGGLSRWRRVSGYWSSHAAELPVFPVELFGGIGTPHLEEVYAVYAGFFFGRFSRESEA